MKALIIIIGICALALFIVLFLIQILGLLRYLDVQKNAIVVKTACAGSEKPNTPNEVEITNLRRDDFYSSTGEKIDIDKYTCYIAKGKSMLLGGIDDSDLLLTKPIDIASLSFQNPSILVLRRENNALEKAAWVNDCAELKIRRSWAKCNIAKEDPIKFAEKIMENSLFIDLKEDYNDKFPSKEMLISDFKSRIDCYKQDYRNCENDGDENCITIISTTLDTRKQKVHFSIHPARTAVGEVAYSFNLKETA